MTTKQETAVRDAANALHKAIGEARATGLAVTFPRRIEDLPTIAISATGKVPSTAAAKPQAAAPKAGDKA